MSPRARGYGGGRRPPAPITFYYSAHLCSLELSVGIIRSGMATNTAERKSADDDGALRDDDRDENNAPQSKSGLSKAGGKYSL